MNKLKKIYIIIGIIILLGIVVIIKKTPYFNTPIYSVKGLTLDKDGKFIKLIDLGIYKEKSKIYDQYPVYILNNNSDFNILNLSDVEVKYPNNLTRYYYQDEDKFTLFMDNESRFFLEIRNKKNENGQTAKEFLESLQIKQKALLDMLKQVSLKNNDTFEYELQGNKVISRCNSKENSTGLLTMYFVSENNIKSLRFSYSKGFKNNENKEMILKTIEESFKLKDS